MNLLSAPQIDNYINYLNHSKMRFDKNTWDLINSMYEILDKIKPCGEDNLHELWITIPRGNISDYGNYEEFVQDEIVSNYKEFETMWKRDYPNDIYWYKLSTISFMQKDDKEFKAIFLNSKLIAQSPNIETTGFEMNISYLIETIIHSVKYCLDKMEKEIYNDYVKDNLPFENRYGTIKRSDFWKVYPDAKEDYFSNFSQSEIDELKYFLSLQENMQKDMKVKYRASKLIGRISKMTSGKFYYYCYLGYKANNYPNCETLTPKELYYENADGRDDGLKDIDENSFEEFDRWYNDQTRFGGHPWEVCRGGNSTHVSLYVMHDEYGYYFRVAGKSYNRSIETIKFFLALKKADIPVFLSDAKELLSRVLATDRIGIVPHFIMPFYCESCFPNDTILDFIHLDVDNKEILKYIDWQSEEEQYLA